MRDKSALGGQTHSPGNPGLAIPPSQTRFLKETPRQITLQEFIRCIYLSRPRAWPSEFSN